jgi:hypothetical protein
MAITGTVAEPTRLSSFGATSNRCADAWHQSLRRQSYSAFLQRKLIIEHHFAERKSLL